MIRADINENFMISVALWDETTGENASGKIVYYDMRDNDDVVLSPAVNGVLIESTVTSGIYSEELSIGEPGGYICYTTCSGFFSGQEEIIINSDNIYDLVDQNYNELQDIQTKQAKILGLSHENVYIDNTAYDAFGNLSSARVRIYSNSASVGSDNDVINTYQISSTSSETGKFIVWEQKEV